MNLNLENFTRSDIMAILSLIISLYAIYVARKNNKENLAFQYHTKYDEKLKPYRELANKAYSELKNVLSDFSNIAYKAYSEIYSYTDLFTNNKNTRRIKLRHHLDEIVTIFLKDIADEILFQPIEYIQTNRISRISSTSKIDLDSHTHENGIKFHLKILYENFEITKKDEYCDFVKRHLNGVHKIYEDNQELINKAIKKLELAKINYKSDFGGYVLNETYNNLSELLNLLLYIKEDAKGLYFNEHEWLFLSYVSANLAEIMMINEGISKISRIGA